MSYASSWILLQLIIIPQPQPHYGLLALNKHRRMVVEGKSESRGCWKLISSAFRGGNQKEAFKCQTHALQTQASQENKY